jgi:hypothetical protein
MVYPEERNVEFSTDDFEVDGEADYGMLSKSLTEEPLKGNEGKSALDISEAQHQPATADEKPRVEYVENIREPYWDTKNVVGAQRHLTPTKSSLEEVPARPGFWQRRWRHYRRYWILYTIGLVIFLAIALPIL